MEVPLRPPLAWALLAGAAPAAAAPLACPPGTAESRADDRGESVRWCARADGTLHGPSERRRADGGLASAGQWVEGVAEGEWRLVEPDGAVTRGLLESGVAVGSWTTLRDGEVAARVDWGPPPDEAADAPLPAEAPALWAVALPAAALGIWPAEDGLWVQLPAAVELRDAETGALRWRGADGLRLRGGLLPVRGGALGVTADGGLLALDARDGASRVIHVGSGVSAVAGADAERAWARDADGRLIAVDLDTGERRWISAAPVDPVPPARIEAEALIVGARGRDLRAVDADTGALRWQVRAGGPVQALAAWEGQLVSVDAHGELLLVDAATGSPRAALRLPGLAAGAVTLRPGPGALAIVAGHRAWRVDADGAPLPGAPPEGAGDAELDPASGVACLAGPAGLRCALDGVPIELPMAPAATPPRVAGGQAFVAGADGRLQRIDLGLAAALGDGGGDVVLIEELELHVTEPSGAEAGLWAEAWRVGPADEGCAGDTLLIDLRDHGPLAEGARVELPPMPDAGQRPAPGWSLDPLPDALWEMRWWTRWAPRLLGVTPASGDPSDAAALEATLRCEGPPVALRGEVRVEGRWQLRGGALELHPEPQRLDGEPGCLIHLWVDGAPAGTWSAPGRPGWVELGLRAAGPGLDPVLGDIADGALPDVLEGALQVDVLLPDAPGRQQLAAEGRLEPRLIEDAITGWDRLELWLDGVLWLGMPVQGLRPARVEVDADGAPVAVPDRRRETVAAHDGDVALPAGLVPVWSPACP